MKIERFGDWKLARQLLSNSTLKLKRSIGAAMHQESESLKKEIVQGITKQSPGGKSFRPLSPLTLASRRLRNFRGTKALMVSGELKDAVTAIVRPDEAFIGVPKRARTKDGTPAIDVAEINEYGSDPIVIPITKTMRKYLFLLYAEAGRRRTGGSGRGVVVIRIPPRPFLRPAFEKHSRGAGQRFMIRVARRLGWGR